jgi:uncharacterized membrane protein|tara:strand:- start:263 stop:367 length:105 start_codon:yes stop_codon:yes gene_type:complete
MSFSLLMIVITLGLLVVVALGIRDIIRVIIGDDL